MKTIMTIKDRAVLDAHLDAMRNRRQETIQAAAADTIPPDVLRGYIAAQDEILARKDLTPCRRLHHNAKRAGYMAMLEAGEKQ